MHKHFKKILVFVLVVTATFVLLHIVFPLPVSSSYSKIIYDRKGDVVHAFLSPDDKWRFKTELKEISPLLKKALLEKEDKYFYYHPGINPASMLRALVKNVFKLKRTSGASTITMQVARMMEPKRRTYFNKAIEIFRAFQLEWKYSKDEIFQLYINLVPYGGNIEGIKSASLIFFNKSPDHLSLAEITALSVIPNRPSSLKLGVNNDAIVTARNKWLNYFLESKTFDKNEITDAINEPLTSRRNLLPGFAPHFSLRLKNTDAVNIRTTIDLETQRKAERIVLDYAQKLHAYGIQNAAVLVINNSTHEVAAYVGSADFSNAADGGQVDGIRAIRQPGSTLKPLLYGLCFDNGLLTPKTIIADVPTNFDGYYPENYDSKFRGAVTVQYALENSLNIPAVKALNLLGKEKLIWSLERCRFGQIKRDEKKLGLSMILGGCGVTLEEMTSLFSAIANDGVYAPANFLLNQNRGVGDTILSASSSFMLTEILSQIARPDLPTNWEGSTKLPRIAWKTGTSYGRRDAWSIGFNKRFTIGVWVGNFSGVGVPELNGAAIATPLLFQLFNTIDYNSPNEWYAMPRECGIRSVCSETGLIPNHFCENIVNDYFIPMQSSNKVCEHKKEVAVSANEKFSYCTDCIPENGYKKKWYASPSPELQFWFEENNVPYSKVPPHNPNCERISDAGAPKIVSPVNNNEYLLDKQNPEPLQLSCQTDAEVSSVFWYINNKLWRKAKANEKIFFTPEEGSVKISCTDDKARNSDVWIKVRYVKL